MNRRQYVLCVHRFVILAVAFALWFVDVQGSEPMEQQAPSTAAGSQQQESWIKSIQDRANRGTLQDVLQIVRGDTGKWSDEPRLQHAPPIQLKPANMLLDVWSDQLHRKATKVTSKDDNWLLFRTEQLNDNDRMWVERIERRGNDFTVLVHQAIWRGKYRKNFTYHIIVGLNLGQLTAGTYQATWVIKPLVFDKLDQPIRADNWPIDERPSDQKLTELHVTFTIAPPAP